MTPEMLAGYELLERIAVGGMGEVFRARKVGPGGFEKLFAIKRLLPEVARDPQLVEMFFQEARLSASLSAPGLVQVFDFGEAGSLPYLVMELVEGSDLAALVTRGPLSPALAVHVASSLAQTLEVLHRAGVVHRDVTPSNVLVARDGAIKLADLGIAKARAGGRRTEPGAVKGKLQYLAPEQLRGEEADARTDLYMLGLVLFEALTGEPYLQAPNDAALIRAAERPVFRAPSSLVAGIPAAVDEIVRRALDPEREQRFPSAEAPATDAGRQRRIAGSRRGSPAAGGAGSRASRRGSQAFGAFSGCAFLARRSRAAEDRSPRARDFAGATADVAAPGEAPASPHCSGGSSAGLCRGYRSGPTRSSGRRLAALRAEACSSGARARHCRTGCGVGTRETQYAACDANAGVSSGSSKAATPTAVSCASHGANLDGADQSRSAAQRACNSNGGPA
ncbi:MAG: protein kinase [Myxococcales bacterium]